MRIITLGEFMGIKSLVLLLLAFPLIANAGAISGTWACRRQLMHARGYAVAAIGLDRRRAAGESAEQDDGYDKRK